ncbi:hypothetical protein [Spiroplasma turonicum]|uniref:Uncharacterized protein n=1 Tax=Spiroplasma turonicum TaxID=216946 RepID=A0A0K1P871_9MOLU|nr:hypothetical protein [Spiroplasma turonicum]AKU80092.1 hypothetical protein STURON_00846 [Spiroplasma turonicum]ALX71093.1 hypothetical protein STURO_v1c08420 [Spiroplasma turonicum]
MNRFTVFKFSLLRVIKNKMYIIGFSILIWINIILMLCIFLIAKSFSTITISTIPVFIINFLFLAFFNISNIADFFIQDNISNLESLMIRKGKKPKNIFFSKIFINKLVSFSYIFLIILIYFLLSFLVQNQYQEIVTYKYSLGLFVLFAFDLFITAITLFLAVFTKSYKKTLPLPWIFTTFIGLYPVLGPMIIYLITMGQPSFSETTNAYNYGKYDSYLERKNDNSILIKLFNDYKSKASLKSQYENLFSDENLKIDYSGTESKSNVIDSARSLIIDYTMNNFMSLEMYILNNNNQYINFWKDFFNLNDQNSSFKIEFSKNFTTKLLDLQKKDDFLMDLVTAAPEEVDPIFNKNIYWDNSYFSTNVYKSLFKKSGLSSPESFTNFDKILDNYNKNDLSKINKIIKNQVLYYYSNTKFYYNSFGFNIFDFYEHIDTFNKYFRIPYNYHTFIYFLTELLQEPGVDQGKSLYEFYNFYSISKNFYNLNPFLQIFVMSNNMGSKDNYYDQFIYKNLIFPIPYYAHVLQTNEYESFKDPSIDGEYKLTNSFFKLEYIYLAWILIPISIFSLSFLIYYKKIYVKSKEG